MKKTWCENFDSRRFCEYSERAKVCADNPYNAKTEVDSNSRRNERSVHHKRWFYLPKEKLLLLAWVKNHPWLSKVGKKNQDKEKNSFSAQSTRSYSGLLRIFGQLITVLPNQHSEGRHGMRFITKWWRGEPCLYNSNDSLEPNTQTVHHNTSKKYLERRSG